MSIKSFPIQVLDLHSEGLRDLRKRREPGIVILVKHLEYVVVFHAHFLCEAVLGHALLFQNFRQDESSHPLSSMQGYLL